MATRHRRRLNGRLRNRTGFESRDNEVIGTAGARMRREEVWTLGVVGGSAAIPVLRHALRDDDVEVRREAVWALARIGGTAVVPALQDARRDKDTEVRGLATEVLAAIAKRPPLDADKPTASPSPSPPQLIAADAVRLALKKRRA